jgi:CDP-6-deoxy-D-xylo-4-hexulose-3-dehydrase
MVFLFEDTGYNFEPSEISAAFGNVQMDRLLEFNERRQQNFARLDEVLAQHEDRVVRARTTPEVDTTWMRFPFLLRDGIDRTAMQEFLLERGIPSRMVWTGNILRQPGFAGIEHRAPAGGLPEADRVMDRGLTLPSHHGLSSDAVGHIAESLHLFLRDPV